MLIEELAPRLAFEKLNAQEHADLTSFGYQFKYLLHKLQGVTERWICHYVTIMVTCTLQEINIRLAIASVDKIRSCGKFAVSLKDLGKVTSATRWLPDVAKVRLNFK